LSDTGLFDDAVLVAVEESVQPTGPVPERALAEERFIHPSVTLLAIVIFAVSAVGA